MNFIDKSFYEYYVPNGFMNNGQFARICLNIENCVIGKSFDWCHNGVDKIDKGDLIM